MKQIMKIDKNFGYIYGVYLGDGYISFTNRKSQPNHFGVKSKDRNFLENILNKWNKSLGLNISKSNIKKINHMNAKRGYVWSIRLFSQEACKFILKFNINRCKLLSKKIQTSILRGLYDSEGSIDKYEIHFCNTDKQIIKLVQQLLSNLGIEYKSQIRKGTGSYSENPKPYLAIRIINRRNILRFRDEIGFNIKRKQKKLIKVTTIPSLIVNKKELRITRNGMYRKGSNGYNLCKCDNYKAKNSPRCWDCYLNEGKVKVVT